MPNSITKTKIPHLSTFDFQIKYTETDKKSHNHETDIHTHDEFEIYINIEGDISFLVESSIYPVKRGDVIISRPGEHHHCIYNSNAPHKLYWILFDCKKNKDILDFWLKGTSNNFISPDSDMKNELLEICDLLYKNQNSPEDKIYYFFRLLRILKSSNKNSFTDTSTTSAELTSIIDYINAHIYEDIKITDICNATYISQSTVERRFKEHLKMNPLEFIRQKKMVLAAEMLKSGETVTNVGQTVGYADNSHFIKLFKRYYGVTPYQYKKPRD